MTAFIGLFPFINTIAWIFPVASLIRDLVKDKESKIRDALILVGVSTDLQRLSWLIMPGSIYFLGGFLVSIECWGAFWIRSDWFVVFIFTQCFIFSMLGFVSFIAAISSKATRASAIGGLAFYGTYLVYGPISAWGDNMVAWVRWIFYLFPCTAMSEAASIMGKLQVMGKGISVSGEISWDFTPDARFYPAFYAPLLMMVVDGILGFLLAWYIENLSPGESNRPQPWYFPFSRDYWLGEGSGKQDYESDKPDKLPIQYNHEPNLENKEAGITMQNLSRKYGKKGPLAVNNVSVEFYKGQITAYLGRNGAGKTSTLQMLAGMARPTTGTAWIDEFNVVNQPELAHKYIGNCPQYNILIDELSPIEHISFYARLRDPYRQQTDIQEQTDELIKAVGLKSDRCNTPSAFLSGGMKRKLSIALSFVGQPKVVFLDEPTAGVDPEARRAIWKLLQEYQNSRKDITMVLCTHHLDEAELLGDRVVIIDSGEIKCAGSNLWMKNQYGEGYILTLSKSKSEPFDQPSFETLFPEAQLKSDISNMSSEIEYIIPYTIFQQSAFIDKLEKLDASYKDFGLLNYGIRDTTLEEIFLKLADTPNKDYEKEETRPASASFKNKVVDSDLPENAENGIAPEDDELFYNSKQLAGWHLTFQQFRGIAVKRIMVSSRDWKSAISQLLLPVAFILLALSFTLITPSINNWPAIELTPWLYRDIQSFSSVESSDPMFTNLDQNLQNNPGWSTLCMQEYTPSVCDTCLPVSCNRDESAYWADPYASLESQTAQRFLAVVLGDSYAPNCQCPGLDITHTSPVFRNCPDGAGNTQIKATNTPFQIFRSDLTDFKIVNYTADSFNKFTLERLGAISVGVTNNVENTGSGALPAYLSNPQYVNPNNVRIWYSNSVFHAAPSYFNVFSNALLRQSTASTDPKTQVGISTFNSPAEATDDDSQKIAITAQLILDTILALSVIFALSFLPASYIVILVDENEVGAKHLQLVAGLQQFPFWLANWLWDFVIYIIAAVLTFLIFLAFQEESFVAAPNWLAFLLLLIFYGWAVIPLEYPFYRLFKNSGSAYVAMLALNILLGVGLCAMIFVLQFLGQTEPAVQTAYDILSWALLIVPHFAFGQGMIEMGQNYANYQALKFINPDADLPSPLDFDIVGKNILFLFLEGLLFFALLVWWEWYMERTSVSKPTPRNREFDEDIDVAEERKLVDQTVASKNFEDQILVVDALNKTFQRPLTEQKEKLDNSLCCKGSCFSWIKKICCCCCSEDTKTMTAVDQLSFQVKPGECFGLLGVNGAGKTTTFKMITGEISPNFGSVTVNGISMFDNPVEARSILGYCPQSDALNVLLTSEEHLVLYARIRGTPENYVSKQVDRALNRFGLAGKWASRKAGQLSGGGKRRLNAAVAFSGNPKLVLLDEPTAGLDPAARNQVWTRVKKLAKQGTSLVLTSHSVSECEQVCNRLAIMVAGKFYCIGSPQHIINRFGKGFIVTIRLNKDNKNSPRNSQDVAAGHQTNFGFELSDSEEATSASQLQVEGDISTKLTNFLKSNFNDTKVVEQQLTILKYRIGETKPISISKILKVLEQSKQENLSRDYSITQATLDDVFISFARESEAEEGTHHQNAAFDADTQAVVV